MYFTEELACDHAGWMEQRRSYIGASDTPKVLGYSSWGTPWDVWAVKTGRVPAPVVDNHAVDFGKHMEPILIQKAGEELGDCVMHCTKFTCRMEEHPFISATPDGIVGDFPQPGQDWLAAPEYIIECKIANFYDSKDWDLLMGGEVPAFSGKVGGYYLQIQQQMLVTGAPYGYFAIALNNQFHLIEVVADLAVQQMIKASLIAWWQRHIVEDIEPEQTSDSLDIQATIEHDKDVEVDLTEHSHLLDEYVRGAELVREGSEIKRRALSKMAALAGDAGRIVFFPDTPDQRKGGWKKPSETVTAADLKKYDKDLYEECRSGAVSLRKLRNRDMHAYEKLVKRGKASFSMFSGKKKS